MNVIHKARIQASIAKVAEALCSEGYNCEAELGRDGVVSTAFREVERTSQRVVFELRTVEYKRTKTGGVDKSGTFVSITRSELDLASHTLSWKYGTESGSSRVKLSGVNRLKAEGPATDLEHEVRIEVDIPLIGGQIAKLIGREFKAGLGRYDDILLRHVGQ